MESNETDRLTTVELTLAQQGGAWLDVNRRLEAVERKQREQATMLDAVERRQRAETARLDRYEARLKVVETS